MKTTIKLDKQGQKLKRYMKAGKSLTLTCNGSAGKWNAYYMEKGELVRISFHAFLTADVWQEFVNNHDFDSGVRYLKNMDKKGVIRLPGYYSFADQDYNFRCTAIGTSRPLEIVLAIGYALGLNFSEIKQNYRVI